MGAVAKRERCRGRQNGADYAWAKGLVFECAMHEKGFFFQDQCARESGLNSDSRSIGHEGIHRIAIM